MNKLQEIRLKKGLSQTQLAEQSGVNIWSIQEYERKAIRKPIEGARLETLLKLAIILDCRIQDIINDPELITLLNMYENKFVKIC